MPLSVLFIGKCEKTLKIIIIIVTVGYYSTHSVEIRRPFHLYVGTGVACMVSFSISRASSLDCLYKAASTVWEPATIR